METVSKLLNNKKMKYNKNILAKTVLFGIALLSTQMAFSQIGMNNFMSDLAGTPGGGGGGNGVPIDGGISAMIASSMYYGYKQMRKKRKA